MVKNVYAEKPSKPQPQRRSTTPHGSPKFEPIHRVYYETPWKNYQEIHKLPRDYNPFDETSEAFSNFELEVDGIRRRFPRKIPEPPPPIIGTPSGSPKVQPIHRAYYESPWKNFEAIDKLPKYVNPYEPKSDAHHDSYYFPIINKPRRNLARRTLKPNFMNTRRSLHQSSAKSTPPKPSICRKCQQSFESSNKLHEHLRTNYQRRFANELSLFSESSQISSPFIHSPSKLSLPLAGSSAKESPPLAKNPSKQSSLLAKTPPKQSSSFVENPP